MLKILLILTMFQSNFIDVNYTVNNPVTFGKTISIQGHVMATKRTDKGNYIIVTFKQKTWRVWVKNDVFELVRKKDYLVLSNCEMR